MSVKRWRFRSASAAKFSDISYSLTSTALGPFRFPFGIVDRQCQCFLKAFQNDGRVRVHHSRDRLYPFAKQASEMVSVLRPHLHEKAILTGDLVDFLHLGDRC